MLEKLSLLQLLYC